MSKEMSVILLGVSVIIVPYLGVPSSWRTLLLVLAGLALVVIGFVLRTQGMGGDKNSKYSTFVETDATAAAHNSHESHKEGITSLN